MKKILFLACFLPFTLLAQKQKITLKDAIKKAQTESPDYQSTKNRYYAQFWRYKNFKASFLPELRLDASPSYTNSIQRIQQNDGTFNFIKQNTAVGSFDLGIRQNVPFTGGTIFVSSGLNAIYNFNEDNSTTKSFSAVPFSISYSQNSLFFNEYRWSKKIEPLMNESAKKEFVENMENISLETSRLFFAQLKAQKQLEIAQKNLSNQDTLYKISKGRFKIGTIAENELLQMELSKLNAENDVTNSELQLKLARQNFSRYLGLENQELDLEFPENLTHFEVDEQTALEYAKNNRKAVIDFRRRRLEAERNLAREKGSNLLEFSISGNVGTNSQASEFNTLYDNNNFSQSQNVSLRLGIPIFDWGVRKSKVKIAQADLDLTKTEIENQEIQFEQEISLQTLRWKNQKNTLIIAEKAKEVALKRYDITKKRYILGKITITDLNIAQQEQDRAVVSYLNTLENYWNDYYTLRRLTLYDFENNQPLTFESIYKE
ncbi:TolC family protein [Aureivirga sp. CE67]|uniref:TolC family protein n=1 Tax=Aureivirga sp. CE67 TaxID=1788983 RepID=UPI0018C98DF0|nr:TolC family protein [Aureivirga sp. CE67]